MLEGVEVIADLMLIDSVVLAVVFLNAIKIVTIIKNVAKRYLINFILKYCNKVKSK